MVSPVLQSNQGLWRVAFGLLGVAILAVSSQIALPFYPVPVTMQSLCVLLIGMVFGARFGGLIVCGWLLAAGLGLPVLADGSGGIDTLTGPTAGYLLAFPVVAFLAGQLPQSRTAEGHAYRICGLVALHGIILALGAGWLATLIGVEDAIAGGALPFLIGGALKSILGAVIFAAIPEHFIARMRS